MKTFVGELKRRNVFRVGLTYLVVAWLVVQIVNNLVPILNAPDWVAKVVLIFLVAGFPISLVLAWAYELTPDGIKRDTGRADAPTTQHGFGRKWDFVIIAGLILALGYFAWDRFGAAPTQQAADQTPSGTVTLAVLPFEDLSPNKDQGYFVDGMTEELLNTLSRVKGLQVTARTSSFAFRGKGQDMRAIGKALGVENLLEGSLRKDGDDIRITAQLINANTGYHLWSETYDRKVADIFKAQDKIATAVAGALQIKLGVGVIGAVPGMTRNVEAYNEMLLSGTYSGRYDPESVRQAIAHAERAVELDPGFSLGWITVAAAYQRGVQLVPDRATEWQKMAGDAVANAVKAAPDSPYIEHAQGETAIANRKWREAGTFFEKFRVATAKYGLQLNYWIADGNFLLRVGRAREAVDELERAKAIDPLNSGTALRLGEAYSSSGSQAEGMAEYDRGLGLAGNRSILRAAALITALGGRDRAEIRKRLSDIAAHQDPNADFYVAMEHLLDDPAAARAELHRRVDPQDVHRDPFMSQTLATWEAYYGEQDQALKLLQAYVASRANPVGVTYEFWLPVFDGLRKLPGFKDLVRKEGLVDYWRAYKWPDFCHSVGDTDFECE
jgi:TolB-like protein/Tfp pilus assembly protein PilF